MDAAERRIRVAAVFDRSADTYDQVGVPWFTPIARGLVDEVAPRQGERALDIGCGRGAATFALAKALGPTGSVTGIDLASRMVAATRAEAAERGLTNVELAVMDAAAPGLPAAAFDLVVASLVLFFLPDPGEALRAWRELLRPGGRLGLATFGPRTPDWIAIDGVFTPYLPQQLLDARTSGTSGPFATDQGVEDLLTGAGFSGVRTAGLDLPVRFQDVDQWVTWSWSHGQRQMWELVPEAERASVREQVAQRLEECRGADGVMQLSQPVRYTVAQRP